MKYVVTILLLLAGSTASAGNLAVGGHHLCAIGPDRSIKCWGNNSYGQLGNGQTGVAINFLPVTVKMDPKDRPISVTAGFKHTCALLWTGTVKCWGANDLGQLGSGNFWSSSTPLAVQGLDKVKGIVAGVQHTCAIREAGDVKCWGYNKSGQVGNNKTSASETSAQAVGVKTPITDLALGNKHSCALFYNGAVACWGGNEFGQLGMGTKDNTNYPTPVANIDLGGKKATAIVAGHSHTCALMEDGTVKCWGWNGNFQQGEKIMTGNNLSPISVKGFEKTKKIAVGYNFTCGLNQSNSVLCLGGDMMGQLGNGKKGVQGFSQPQLVQNLSNVTDLFSGPAAMHACALSGQNQVLSCWGSSTYGQSGIDPKSKSIQSCTNNNTCTPVPITLNIAVTAPKNDQAGAATGGGGGSGSGSSSPPALYEYLEKNFPAFQDLYFQLITATVAANASYEKMQQQVWDAVEPKVTDMLNKKKPELPNETVLPVPARAEWDKMVAKQKDLFQQLTNLYVGMLLKDTGIKGFDAINNVYYQGAANIYFAVLFTSLVNRPLPTSGGGCTGDMIKDGLMYSYVGSHYSDKNMNKKALGELVAQIYCLSQKQANIVDEAIGTAYKIETEIVKKLRPEYANATQDSLLTLLAPVILVLNDKNRFEGKDVPSVKLLGTYTERLNKADIFAKDYAKMVPDNLLLYNTVSKKVEELSYCSPEIEKQLYKATNNPAYLSNKFESLLPKVAGGEGAKTPYGVPGSQVQTLCSGGGWNEPVIWYQDSAGKGCIVYKNFINVANNPVMKGYGLCSMWNNDRIGKMCCVLPSAKKTSKNDSKAVTKNNWLVKIINGFTGSIAYADDAYGNSCLDCNCDLLSICKGYTWKYTQICTDDAGSSKKTCFDGISYDVKYYCKGGGVDNEGKPLDTCSESGGLFNKKLIECQVGISSCYAECGKAKGLACIPPSPGNPVCGNGKIEVGEACDDGNTMSYDGCSFDCTEKDKPKKKWCEECFYPKFKHPKCDFYFNLKQENKNNPSCTNPFTELDSQGCVKFKKYEPCAVAEMYARNECYKVRGPCLEKCKKDEGPPPPSDPLLTEDQKKACLEDMPPVPFGSGTVEAAKDGLKDWTDDSPYGKTILAFKNEGAEYLQQYWWAVVDWLQKESGISFDNDDLGNALNDALDLLDKSLPCEGEELKDMKAIESIARYVDEKHICWNPDGFKQLFDWNAASAGAHEATHAAVDHLWAATEKRLGQSLPKACAADAWGGGGVDHWMMSVLNNTVPGFVMTPVMITGVMKPSVCPYVLEGQ